VDAHSLPTLSRIQNRITFKSKQSPLKTVRQLTQEEVDDLDRTAAYEIYCGMRPFSLYTDPYLKSLLHKLAPEYTLPSPNTFGTKLLDLCYEETRREVCDALKLTKRWNLAVDESSNINHDRIINLCILTKFGPFSIKYELVGTGTSSAGRIAQWINHQLEDLTQFLEIEVPEINSVTTDTCNTMRSLWDELRAYRPFKRTIMIPCDSHGLQLLIKDIIEMIDPYKVTMERSNVIVAYFNKAHKQLALLRAHQRKAY